MKNRIAQQRQQDYFEAATDRAAGRDRLLLLFSASAEILTRVADISKVPSARNNTSLMDADGNFYFLVGYSEIGGGDVIP